jgi:hypothetical protein
MKNIMKALIKRFTLVTTLVGGLGLLAGAQQKSPADRANATTQRLQKTLNLLPGQVLQVNTILLEEYKGLDSLNTVNQGADRKTNSQIRKAFADQSEAKLTAIFTDEQKNSYSNMLQAQRDKRAAQKGHLQGIN